MLSVIFIAIAIVYGQQNIEVGKSIIETYINQQEFYPLHTEEVLLKYGIYLAAAGKDMELIQKNTFNFFVKENECYTDMKILLNRYRDCLDLPLIKDNPQFTDCEAKGFLANNMYYKTYEIYYVADIFRKRAKLYPNQEKSYIELAEKLELYGEKITNIRHINGGNFYMSRVSIGNLKRLMTKEEYENEIWPVSPVNFVSIYKECKKNEEITDKQLKVIEQQRATRMMRWWFGFANSATNKETK